MTSAPHSPRATVIVSTYENPAALDLVFAGLRRQTRTDFEVLVADDGSGKETAAVIERFRRTCDFTVGHVWQPNQGLRKGRALNRAIVAAAGDQVLFLDGDCIPGPTFVARHIALFRPGTYLSGSCVLLGEEATQALTPARVSEGALDGLRSCRSGNRRARRLIAGFVPGLCSVFDRALAADPVGFHGGNASVARADAVAVGGFDERLARFEDKDLGLRLRRHGLVGTSVRYRVPVWHTHHERGYVDQAMRDASRATYEANIAAGVVRTEHGLARDTTIEADRTRE